MLIGFLVWMVDASNPLQPLFGLVDYGDEKHKTTNVSHFLLLNHGCVLTLPHMWSCSQQLASYSWWHHVA